MEFIHVKQFHARIGLFKLKVNGKDLVASVVLRNQETLPLEEVEERFRQLNKLVQDLITDKEK